MANPHPASRLLARMLSCAAAASAILTAAGETRDSFELKEGQVAPHAIYAPVEIDVVDTERTIAIHTAAGERLPLVAQIDGGVETSAVARFNTAFRETRESFIAALKETYGTDTLTVEQTNDPAFREFRERFQAGNTRMPINLVLAQTWSRSYDGNGTRERLVEAIKSVYREFLIGDLRPASTIFLVQPKQIGRVRSWGEVASRVQTVEPGVVVDVSTAAERLGRRLDSLDRTSGGFLAGMLSANVSEDRYLTGLLLRERLGAAVEHRRFAEGALIVGAGATLDRWGALALEDLRRGGIAPLSEAPPLTTRTTARPAVWRIRKVLWSAIGGVVLVTALIVFWRIRAGRHPRWLATTESLPPSTLRAAIVPHLARELKDRLVGALFTQRQALLENERIASERVREMEERLARLQPAIAEKIRGYELRIAALERELAEKDRETRDLIRAKLVLARKELEAEMVRNRITWN